jgi:hypothetical protein
MWESIRRRDSKYEARRVFEIDDFDSSDDENIDYSLGFGDTTRRHCNTKAIRDHIQDERRTTNLKEKCCALKKKVNCS